MSGMVERVKRALEPYLHDMITLEAREAAARAAIEAMREPTEAMVKAGIDFDRGHCSTERLVGILRAMIDAALED